MKINEKHLKELRQCELYQRILPRYQKNIEWILKEYIKATEEEYITTKVYFVTTLKNDSIKIHSPINLEVNRRSLLNLSALDFEFGLQFTSDKFMPFFGEQEIALFKNLPNNFEVDNIEDGDICLVKSKINNEIWLATKEKTGFFKLDCSYLDSGKDLIAIATMINIETKKIATAY